MKKITCESCGGNSFRIKGNTYECEFCGSKFSFGDDSTIVDKTLTNVKIVQYYLDAAKFQLSNDFSNELKVLTNALEIDKTNPLTMVKIGRCYRNLHLHAEAIKMYKKAIEIDEEIGTAYTNLGTISILNKNWAEAISYYKKGLKYIDKNEDDYWTAYANYAIAVAKMGDITTAEKMISEAESHGYKNGDGCRQMAGISKKGCYVATCVYGSYDCPQVWTLRRYRDTTLASTWFGRAFIHTYYAISPTIVKWFGDTQWFKKLWKTRLDKMVYNLRSNGFDDTPYQDKDWR